MRLTLRTLLAHLDGMLEPADAEELGRKIQDSEFARTVVHRVRETTKKTRLGAPKVLGKGTGLDPNTVADYLDSTLPPERAPDFEKVCLESDVHLAEVAACHQILTMVLGEPAEIDPASRRRMYALPGHAQQSATESDDESVAAEPLVVGVHAPALDEPEMSDAMQQGSPSPGPTAVGQPSPVAPVRRQQLEVPDYLRHGAGRRKAVWGIIAASVVIAASLFIFAREPIGRMLGLATPDTSGGASTAGTGAASSGSANAQSKPVPSDVPVEQKSDVVNPSGDVPPTEKPIPSPTDGNATDVRPADTLPLPPAPTEKSDGANTLPDKPVDPPKTEIPADKPVPPVETDDTQPPAAKPVPDGVPVGQNQTAEEILLRYDAKEDNWIRLPNGAPLATGDRLLAPPGFRPRIALNSGLTLQLGGGAIIEFFTTPEANVPGLRVVHGRVTRIATAGRAGVACQLALGELTGLATFADPDSTAAVEVSRFYEPGEDPMTTAGASVAELYAVGGTLTWLDAGKNQPVMIAAGNRRTWIGREIAQTQPVQQLPGWTDPAQPSEIDERGLKTLREQLKPGEPVNQSIRELVNHRQTETRAFAAGAMGLMGRYPALTNGLKDDFAAWKWRMIYIGSMRAAVLRGPDEARRVRDALTKEFGGVAGQELYRMLCGYSAKQLKEGADATLVDDLAHKELPYRVLAFYNLEAITGSSLGYKPEGPDAQRKIPLTKWRDRQRSGGVAYRRAAATTPVDKKPADKPDADPPATDKPPAAVKA